MNEMSVTSYNFLLFYLITNSSSFSSKKLEFAPEGGLLIRFIAMYLLTAFASRDFDLYYQVDLCLLVFEILGM